MRIATVRASGALAVFLLLAAFACHPADQGKPRLDAPLDASAGRPQAQLTWRLFETTRSLDSSGQPRESAVFELLVNGGTPARVALGRRAAMGCAVHEATEGTDGPAVVTTLDCYAYAHGEYARVLRSGADELRVEAFGQDEALPDHEPSRIGVRTATVKIPADAEIVVEPTLLTVPDEVPAQK
jgi:hypothetical protein